MMHLAEANSSLNQIKDLSADARASMALLSVSLCTETSRARERPRDPKDDAPFH